MKSRYDHQGHGFRHGLYPAAQRWTLEGMPELPEVETVRRGLLTTLGAGARIAHAEFRRADLRVPIPPRLKRDLRDQPLLGIDRRAKLLLWRLPRVTMINHLGMTGSWREAPVGHERDHDHCYLHLADGRRLAYRDPRRFGLIEACDPGAEADHACLVGLGPEPLDPTGFTLDHLAAACARRSAAIKAVLMTNAVVVGIGNIYAAEALFRAGIRPHTPARRISRQRLARLIEAVRAVLTEALAAGGSTIRDFRQAGGSSGYFQASFRVYGREDQPCTACATPLKHAVLAQRATVWCPRCQR